MSEFRKGVTLWRVNAQARGWSDPIEVTVSQVRGGYVYLVGGGKFEPPEMSIEQGGEVTDDRVFLARDEAQDYPALLAAWIRLENLVRVSFGQPVPRLRSAAVIEALRLLGGLEAG